MVGRLFSFWDGFLVGAMLVSGSVGFGVGWVAKKGGEVGN